MAENVLITTYPRVRDDTSIEHLAVEFTKL